ncbi:MAG: dephospho-CoA kinase [Spirochaetaceae bacterium]|jgi:dephospho-CoA kinase|nr:dephospho-CoA kinase [Spirochaetaceae bacterium]
MTLAGLTGLSCAGKNYAASLLEAKGIPVLDVDKLGHHALENQKNEVAAVFGTHILIPSEDTDASAAVVDRRALGRLVFANPAALARLEAIIHPEVDKLINQWLADISNKQQPSMCFINAALLHKTAIAKQLNFILVVTAPLLVRIVRAKKRDKLTLREILRRFANQHNFIPSTFFPNAGIIHIPNNGLGIFPAAERRQLEERLEAVLAYKE